MRHGADGCDMSRIVSFFFFLYKPEQKGLSFEDDRVEHEIILICYFSFFCLKKLKNK
jgi:hypothetical protein